VKVARARCGLLPRGVSLSRRDAAGREKTLPRATERRSFAARRATILREKNEHAKTNINL